MTHESSQLTAEEKKRRKDAVLKAEKIARKLGFRKTNNMPGYWWHEDIGIDSMFPFSEEFNPIDSIGDLLAVMHHHARHRGADEVRRSIRKSLNL